VEAQVLWNGHVAAKLPALDTGIVSLELPALHAGHHSIFVQLLCTDASCPHPVNGSVFFSASAAPSPLPQGAAPAPEMHASEVVDAEIAAFECSEDDLAAFLPRHRRRAARAKPAEGEMCRALAELHSLLVRDVQQRPADAQALAALGRFFMARRRVPSAVRLYRAALRRSKEAGSGSGPRPGAGAGADSDLWRVDTCSHLHQALHIAVSLRALRDAAAHAKAWPPPARPAHAPAAQEEEEEMVEQPAHAPAAQHYEHALLMHLRRFIPPDAAGHEHSVGASGNGDRSPREAREARRQGGMAVVEGERAGRGSAEPREVSMPGGERGGRMQEEGGGGGAVSEEEVVFGVVSGRGMYETRARAVAETWMSQAPTPPVPPPPYGPTSANSPPPLPSSSPGVPPVFLSPKATYPSPPTSTLPPCGTYLSHTYIYGDAPHQLRDLDERPWRRGGRGRGGNRSRSILPVPVPDTPEQSWLLRLTLHDDFFSSVPKFVLALVDLYVRHPRAKWFYVAGCDTYLVANNLLLALGGLDSEQRIVVGGHAGMHFDVLFLSGGSGLAFSRGYMATLAPRAPALLRSWMEVDGPRHRCTPCADIFFVHASRLLDAEMLQRPFFFAFWPQYYVTSTAARELGTPAAPTVLWPPQDMPRMGGRLDRVSLEVEREEEFLFADVHCQDIPVFEPGLGALYVSFFFLLGGACGRGRWCAVC
jgi:hypothetical protein